MFLSKEISDFKPHKTGFKKVFGDLEADIMKIIWKSEEVTVREVYEELKLEKKLAYTTVMTIMNRLAEKNLLKRESRGNAFAYTPTISENDFATQVVSEVLDGLLEDFADPALSHIVESLSSKDSQKLNRLEQLIQERRAKGEG